MARGTHAHRHPWLRLALTFVLALGALAVSATSARCELTRSWC